MAEKMAEQIAEILKESDYHTVEKALADFRRPMDGEFRNLLVDIIVERWIDTPKDVPFSYARSIWNRKDINREEYQALLEEIRSYPIAPINKAKISDFLWVVENDFSNAKIAETAYYEHLKNTGAFADHIMAINRILFISKKIRSKEINEEVRKNLLIKVLEEYDNLSLIHISSCSLAYSHAASRRSSLYGAVRWKEKPSRYNWAYSNGSSMASAFNVQMCIRDRLWIMPVRK